MIGPELKAWRDSFSLTQTDVATHFDVSRTTVQNWEAQAGKLPSMLETGVRVWSRRMRQEDPLRGPVTLVFSNVPLFIAPYGPRAPQAVMRQESHPSNAAGLARVQALAGNPAVVHPFILEEGARTLWNIVELQQVSAGDDRGAPTLSNLLRRLAADIRKAPVEAGAKGRERGALAYQLEQIADLPLSDILLEQGNVEGARLQLRNLGFKPRESLTTGITQAFAAAQMPAVAG